MAFVLRLTDEESAELERRRAAGGFRSLNETVKAWLALRDEDIIVRAVLPAIQKRIVEDGDPVVPGGLADVMLRAELIGRPPPKPGSLLKKR